MSSEALYEATGHDRRSVLKVYSDKSRIMGRLEGELELQISKNARKVTVIYTPSKNGVWHVVNGAKRLPLYGCVSLLDHHNGPEPFGHVLRLDRYAVIKAFSHMSRKVELHFYYEGLCVDVIELEAGEVPQYKTFKSDPIQPLKHADVPLEWMLHIDAKLAQNGIRKATA